MMVYYELSNVERGMYGIWTIVLMIIAVSILVNTCTLHRKRQYMLLASMQVAILLFVLQGLSDVNYQLPTGRSFAFFARIIGNLPYGVITLFLLISIVAEMIFILLLWKEKKNRLTPENIKEGMDALPDGICFFTADGQPLLVNTQMNRISGELFDMEILNVEGFWKRLKDGKGIDNGYVLRTEPTLLVRTRDGKNMGFSPESVDN